MKVAHIIGARPQFIKAAMVSRAFKAAGIEEALIHTGQHYDDAMSDVFFRELALPAPAAHLVLTSSSPAAQTGEMVEGLAAVLERLDPDIVLVHGDTNSTLAGALAASQLGLPLAHNEAGLRSYDRSMPEEQNRVITDHRAGLLFCPVQSAAVRLEQEGVQGQIFVTGDVMYDAALYFSAQTAAPGVGMLPAEYALVTIHRQYTADYKPRLSALMDVLEAVPLSMIFPMHPRTVSRMAEFGLHLPDRVTQVTPVGYPGMLQLICNAAYVLTDSGGVQKEAYFFGVPCITLRPETEWTETVDAGWNAVTDLDCAAVTAAIANFDTERPRPAFFGDGHAAEAIARILASIVNE